MSQPRRPTLVAVLARPSDEAVAPGGTLATSAWRGVRTALVTLSGSENPHWRDAAARASLLLGVESHFHWERAAEEDALRLARIFRALQPQVVLTNAVAQPFTQQAWELAADPSEEMPGLLVFDLMRARLWSVADEPASATARVDASAARPLLRALRFYYAPATGESEWEGNTEAYFEYFDLLRGAAVPESEPVTDLFVGLSPSPMRPPISFLAEEDSDASCPDGPTTLLE
ncbi:MAG: PIG-L family deacetylase [Chloroflexota bacterium]|nr:PIG-L family deacetylase [Chloroflexota bacterium]